MSEASLASPWCRLERAYAEGLERPLLPVLVGTATVEAAPEAIRRRALVDFREPTPEAAVSLMNALAQIRPAALPVQLPEPPTDPTALLAGPREQVHAEHLSFDQQAQVASEVLALARTPISTPSSWRSSPHCADGSTSRSW